MAGITLADATTQLAAAIAALEATRKGEVEIKDRKKKPPSLSELRDEIDYWDNKVKELTAKGSRTGPTMKGATPA